VEESATYEGDSLKEIVADVGVVGSGGAGLYAAIKAAESGSKTVLVDKGLIGRSGATVSAGGVTAVGPWSIPEDSQDAHCRDTLESGKHINDTKLVRTLVSGASDRVRELERWGIVFDRTANGDYLLGDAAGHSFPRALLMGDRVGLHVARVLRRRASQLRVNLTEDTFVTSILVQGGKAAGLTAVDARSGQLMAVRCKAVVLATGGAGQLYTVTTNPVQATGDGLALALRAGADLVDMEQVQFYPAGLVFPASLKGVGLGLVEYSMLYNSMGERFLSRYGCRDMERSSRDLLARCVYSEIRAGRTGEHGGVFLDARHVPDSEFSSFQHEYELCLERGLDLKKERAEIAPSAHYCMGGIRIDDKCRSTIPNLYAAGEVTGGVMGANRLNGNSLADIMVFGAIAGKEAAEFARTARVASPGKELIERERERIDRLISRGCGGRRTTELRRETRQIMWDHVGVIRSRESLSKATGLLDDLENELAATALVQKSWKCNPELFAYLELDNMVLVAQAITRSASVRRQSLGAHCLEDRDEGSEREGSLHNVVVRLEQGRLRTQTQPVLCGDCVSRP
jgi:fumarate reductase (CoM/CoB) subunit A